MKEMDRVPSRACNAASRLILEAAILEAPMLFLPRPNFSLGERGQTGPKESDGLAARHAMDFSMCGVLAGKTWKSECNSRVEIQLEE